jgi:hypothetical protein
MESPDTVWTFWRSAANFDGVWTMPQRKNLSARQLWRPNAIGWQTEGLVSSDRSQHTEWSGASDDIARHWIGLEDNANDRQYDSSRGGGL